MIQKTNQQNTDDIIDIKVLLREHQKHLEIANNEMSVVQTDVSWVKGKLEAVEARTWYILTSIIIGFLVTIAINLWK